LTLPGRNWKWRMRGAAPWFATQLASAPEPCDLIVATSLLDVAHLRGLLPPPLDRRPLVLYMHENQLTYPTSPQQRHDHQLGLTNIVSCLAADRVLFNSGFQRDAFLTAIAGYLERMPDAVPPEVPARIAARSEVLAVGLDCEPRGAAPEPEPPGRQLLLWNHRWEFDKRPDQFAGAIGRLLDAGLDFDVVLLGDGRGREQAFAPLVARLGDRCLHAGYLEDRRCYAAWLAAADVVVSCAEQENFGIAVAEAVRAGCYPVLPRRQVYPELYGSRCPGPHFYDDDDQLVALLTDLVSGQGDGHACPLVGAVEQFCWRNLAPRYDELLSEVAGTGGKAR
jgi:glycosyltransferase involved in cell wall biosynthesis